jgi:hypothetical protein
MAVVPLAGVVALAANCWAQADCVCCIAGDCRIN